MTEFNRKEIDEAINVIKLVSHKVGTNPSDEIQRILGLLNRGNLYLKLAIDQYQAINVLSQTPQGVEEHGEFSSESQECRICGSIMPTYCTDPHCELIMSGHHKWSDIKNNRYLTAKEKYNRDIEIAQRLYVKGYLDTVQFNRMYDRLKREFLWVLPNFNDPLEYWDG